MSAGHHVLQESAGDIEEPIEVGVENIVPVIVGHHEHDIISSDASIIYQYGDPLIRMRRFPLVYSSLYLLRLRRIKGQEFSIAALLLNFPFYLFRRLMVVQVIDNRAEAPFGKS